MQEIEKEITKMTNQKTALAQFGIEYRNFAQASKGTFQAEQVLQKLMDSNPEIAAAQAMVKTAKEGLAQAEKDIKAVSLSASQEQGGWDFVNDLPLVGSRKSTSYHSSPDTEEVIIDSFPQYLHYLKLDMSAFKKNVLKKAEEDLLEKLHCDKSEAVSLTFKRDEIERRLRTGEPLDS